MRLRFRLLALRRAFQHKLPDFYYEKKHPRLKLLQTAFLAWTIYDNIREDKEGLQFLIIFPAGENHRSKEYFASEKKILIDYRDPFIGYGRLENA